MLNSQQIEQLQLMAAETEHLVPLPRAIRQYLPPMYSKVECVSADVAIDILNIGESMRNLAEELRESIQTSRHIPLQEKMRLASKAERMVSISKRLGKLLLAAVNRQRRMKGLPVLEIGKNTVAH
ncbi:MAG TPA: hypothetical protein VHP58_02800 [Alphaproteobacteria bacterium]|nr:hypothetical protein [Alphaproteobacteria bacterium]